MSLSTEIKQLTLANYGKCVSIDNGTVKLIISIDVGPKIIFWGYSNGKNILHVPYEIDEDAKNLNSQISTGISLKRYGHNLMLEYENGTSEFLSSGSAVYSLLPEGVRFSYTIPELGINVNLEIITQNSTDSIMIIHSIENTNIEAQNFSICSSTCVAPSGTLLVPQNTENTHNSPNRVLSLWKKSSIKDPRLSIFNKFICFNNMKNADAPPLKLGLNNTNAWATYTKEGNTFLKHYLHNKDAKYLNFGSSFIIDSKKDTLTLKVLSPIYNVQQNEIAKMVEYWSLFSTKINFDDPLEIENFIATLNA